MMNSTCDLKVVFFVVVSCFFLIFSDATFIKIPAGFVFV